MRVAAGVVNRPHQIIVIVMWTTLSTAVPSVLYGPDRDQGLQCGFVRHVRDGDPNHFDSRRLKKLIFSFISFALQFPVV
jgi:hypothetical protein